MSSNPSRSRHCGFALTEALVALLLLAMVMMGTGMALIQSLAGQRSALMLTRAVDLAGNLAEALRSAPDNATVQAEILSWQRDVALQLPQATGDALHRAAASSSAAASGFDIGLQWSTGRSRELAGFMLPVALISPPEGA